MATLAQTRFAGLSTETKPTAMPGGGDIPVGSLCDDVDTGGRFYWDGGAWAAISAGANRNEVADWLAILFPVNVAIRQELVALRLGMTAAGLCSEVSAADLETELTVT